MKAIALRIVLALVIVALLVYAGDYISVAYKIPNGREQFGTVQVQHVVGMKLKDRKTDYTFDAPEPEQCVRSLFPQLGLTPCWYLERHRQQEVDY